MSFNVRIASLACNLPSRLLRNDDPAFDNVEPIPEEWWRFWGIQSRYIIDPECGESELQMAERTAREALELAGVRPTELDLLLFNITSPFVTVDDGARRFAPRLARSLRNALGAHGALDADVDMECASFLLQLQLATNLIKQGRIKRALVCSSERMSALVDYTTKSSTNFGDGAAAAVLVADAHDTQGADWISAVYRSDATHYDLATMQWRHPNPAAEGGEAPRQADRFGVYFTLKPEAQAMIARFMPEAIPDIVERLMRKAGVSLDDIDAMVFHQPSEILVRAWAQRLKLCGDQYAIRLADCGCLVSAALPMALLESIRTGVVRPGSQVILAGAGAGWGFGAQLWRWGETAVAGLQCGVNVEESGHVR
jgi:3-oxoacyl-(acyl-carrier-protein) synthase III